MSKIKEIKEYENLFSGDSLEALPSKEEYQNSKRDFAQILGIIKLIAKKQGMNDQTIEELRPPIIASENEQ